MGFFFWFFFFTLLSYASMCKSDRLLRDSLPLVTSAHFLELRYSVQMRLANTAML